MPRQHPGIKQLGPNLWEIRVQSRSRKTGQKTGRQERFEGSAREAVKRQHEMRAQLAAEGGAPKRARERLASFASTWIESRRASIKPSVYTRYASDLALQILPALGEHYVDALEPTDVDAMLGGARRRDGRPLSANSKRNVLRLLRLIAKAALAAGHITRDFTAGIKAPVPEGYTDDNPNLLTADQLARLLAAVPRQWLAMVVLGAYTGLRWGELSGLHWEDLDLERGLIRIRRANWRGFEVAPKTKSSKRPVPLPARFLEIADVDGAGNRRGLVFPVRQAERAGQAHRGSPLNKVLRRACAAAGVPRITPHGLRRTFNDLGRQVADRLVMKAIVGHTTDAMNEHYSHVRVDEMAIAQRKVMALVEGGAAPRPAIADAARAAYVAFHAGAGDAAAWEDLDDATRDRWIAAAIAARPERP